VKNRVLALSLAGPLFASQGHCQDISQFLVRPEPSICTARDSGLKGALLHTEFALRGLPGVCAAGDLILTTREPETARNH
jgi:hypothetical protein